MKSKIILFLLVAVFSSNLCFSQTDNNNRFLGSWMGQIDIGVPLRVVLKFHIQDGKFVALIDSPDQGAKDIPTGDVRLVKDSLFIDVPALGGNFKGLIRSGDTVLDMMLTQGGKSFHFEMKKLDRELILKRPQEPKQPFPYITEEVMITNKKAGVHLAGTLTLPSDKKVSAAVILISGSGPQNRDEEMFGHKPFLVIADYLTRHGIAVLRYDDRGTFKSTGNNLKATSFDFADDAEAAIDYLRTRKEIDAKHIGIIGHSEGGFIAPVVASRRNDVAFIVLLAGPGIRTIDFLPIQGRMIDEVHHIARDKTDEKIAILNMEYQFFAANNGNSLKCDSLKQILVHTIQNASCFDRDEKKSGAFLYTFPLV